MCGEDFRLETQPKKKWPDKKGTRYEAAVRLTLPEGVAFSQVLRQHNCANISQLCKRIVRVEIELKSKKETQ